MLGTTVKIGNKMKRSVSSDTTSTLVNLNYMNNMHRKSMSELVNMINIFNTHINKVKIKRYQRMGN